MSTFTKEVGLIDGIEEREQWEKKQSEKEAERYNK